MAKFQFRGLNDYISGLQQHSERDLEPAIKKAVFSGAKIVADEIMQEIKALPEEYENDGYGFHPEQKPATSGITKTQKLGLIEGFGISDMETKNGFTNVKIGFVGYNSVKTKKYPKGQPNALIARSVISGTSFRKKNPFVQRAMKRVKDKAEQKMTKTFNEALEKINK